MLSDEALMLEFQSGSREAFEALFERYRQPLYGFFRRRLNGSERALDLTHETFLAVLQNRLRYEPRARLKTYLYGIALHVLAAERRKQRSAPQSFPDLVRQPMTMPAADSTLWVREALEKLQTTEREILMLREFEQLSYSEIADVLRLPVNTVRSKLFRSRMALKQYLEPAGQGERARS